MGYEETINRGLREASATGDILDARRRPLHEGDEILLAVPGPIYFRIAEITPNLHPQAPPGLMTVHVACGLAFVAQRGQVNPEFVRVQTAAEAGPSNVRRIEAPESVTPLDASEKSGVEP